MTGARRSRLMRHPVMLALAVLLTAAGAAIWVLAKLTCGLTEGQPPGTTDYLCGGPGTPGRATILLVATVAVPVAYLVSRWAERPWIFVAAAVANVAAVGSVWLA